MRGLDLFSALISSVLTVASGHGPWQPEQAPRGFEVRVAEANVISGPRVIRVTRGERVEIIWSTDRPHDIHLHGYDIDLRLTPDETKAMAFTAHATGRFPVEIHDAQQRGVLLHVEVHPR